MNHLDAGHIAWQLAVVCVLVASACGCVLEWAERRGR